MNLEQRTVRVEQNNTILFEREIARLNKRASKVGVPAIQFVRGATTETTKRSVVAVVGDGETREEEHEYPVTVVEYTVTVPSRDSFEWSVLAVATKVDDGSTFVEPKVLGLDVKAMSASWDICWCQHCNTRRERNMSYNIKNNTTGVVLNVGRNCFKDYIGANGLAALEFVDTIFSTLSLDDGGEGFGGSRGVNRQANDVRWLIAWAESFFERDGKWVYNKKDQFGNVEAPGMHRWAADAVQEAPALAQLQLETGLDRGFMAERYLEIKDPAHPIWAKVDAILERMATLHVTADDEFGIALQYCCQFDVVPGRKASMVAYAGQYLRSLDQKAAQEARKSTQAYVGTVGKREVFTGLKLVKRASWESQFGTTYMHVFENSEGNILVWKTGTAVANEGDVVSLKGTVKDHSEYNGTKQTILTRCAIV